MAARPCRALWSPRSHQWVTITAGITETAGALPNLGGSGRRPHLGAHSTRCSSVAGMLERLQVPPTRGPSGNAHLQSRSGRSGSLHKAAAGQRPGSTGEAGKGEGSPSSCSRQCSRPRGPVHTWRRTRLREPRSTGLHAGLWGWGRETRSRSQGRVACRPRRAVLLLASTAPAPYRGPGGLILLVMFQDPAWPTLSRWGFRGLQTQHIPVCPPQPQQRGTRCELALRGESAAHALSGPCPPEAARLGQS